MVTGASGFVGQELCEHLGVEGDELLPFGEESAFLDLLDRQAVRDSLVGLGVEAVYHLAALSHVGESFDNPVQTIRVNVEGTVNLLDACRDAGVGRVLVIGSAEQYGNGTGSVKPFTEDSPLRPITPYGVSKVAAEFLSLQAYLSSGLETVMTRSFNHTGPGQSPDFVVPALAARIALAERDGQSEIVVGLLDSVREFNDVRDVVRAYRLLVVHGEPGTVYNVCSGIAYSVQAAADRLIGMARTPLTLRQDPALVRTVESHRLVGNPRRLKEQTGWEPLFSLDQTLADILEQARERIRG